MKTTEDLQAALDAITRVCNEHDVVLRGMSLSEGIYGEIAILAADGDRLRIEPEDGPDLNKPGPEAIDHWVMYIGTPALRR